MGTLTPLGQLYDVLGQMEAKAVRVLRLGLGRDLLASWELPLLAILRPPPFKAKTGLTREWLLIAGAPSCASFLYTL